MRLMIMKRIRWIFVVILFLLCMSASAALAANATYAEINGVTIDASSPYWNNSGGCSSADWNAYFDTSTSPATLWLKDAVVNTINSYDELLYADGDLVLKLLGHSFLEYSGNTASSPAGVVVEGNLWIRDGTADGTGILNISIDNTSPAVDSYGIITLFSLTIESGTIDIFVDYSFESYGLYAEYGEGIFIRGGTTDVYASGAYIEGISAYRFSLSGGEITSTADGVDPDSVALLFLDALITGGYGEFTNVNAGYGAVWVWADFGYFRVIDGRVVFSGEDGALFFDTNRILVPYVTDRIYASTDLSGAGKFIWDSTKGILAEYYLDTSDYHYVEMIGSGVPLPETGDESRPWLWVVVGLAALLLGGAAVIWLKKHK